MFYLVQIHQRIPEGEVQAFLQEVERILGDPRGWPGVTFTRVTTEEDILRVPTEQAFIIRLTPLGVMEKKYPEFKENQLSVANLTDRTIDINHCRWTAQCPNKSQLPLEQYHEYVILHEVGHILGKPHPHPASLPSKGPAPVMMQQTLGIQHLQPNSWPTKFDHTI